MGILISPSRSLLVYTPILFFSILGYFRIFQISNSKIRVFLFVMGLSILALVAVYASFDMWWAGGSYGPRFLSGILPALAVFLGLYVKDINFNIKTRKNLIIICIFSILLIWSVFTQLVGAFYYPNSNWDGYPSDNGLRLWDWKDNQIGRSFNAGIIHPHNPLNDLRFIMFWGKIRHLDRVALRAHNGLYVCAEGGGGRQVVANRNSVVPWEIFFLRNLGNNSVALRAHNGQYVSVESELEVVAKSNSVGSSETFSLKHL